MKRCKLCKKCCTLSSANSTGARQCAAHHGMHRWALTPISVISDIGLSLISELPISDWRKRSPTLYRESEKTFIRYPISDIQKFINQHSGWENKCLGFESCWCDKYYLDIGYRNGLRCRYRNLSDIGMTVFSPTYFLPIRNNRCRCRMSDIADIEVDVDAHLWWYGARALKSNWNI